VFATAALALPPVEAPQRRDGLWKTTCFELFVRAEGNGSYQEFNFSPSHCWAAYSFTGYRDGMRELSLEPPVIMTRRDVSGYSLSVEMELVEPWTPATRIGLSAVIESDGTKSYWALAHPPGPPDFHHPDCFVLKPPSLIRP